MPVRKLRKNMSTRSRFSWSTQGNSASIGTRTLPVSGYGFIRAAGALSSADTDFMDASA
jgi:hypothetical protein